MRISICMPVMGRDAMLSQALYSILAQGHDDLEIVLKDGDPEHPLWHEPRFKKAISCFADGQVNYEVSHDGGIFPALNNCLRRATGDIIYFMCSDDLLCAGAFQTVNTIFENEKFGGAFWLYGKTVSADETGKTLGIDGEPLFVDQTLGIFRHHAGSDTQIHPEETNAMAKKVSLRHFTMGPILARARSRWVDRRAYGWDETPLSHDELGIK